MGGPMGGPVREMAAEPVNASPAAHVEDMPADNGAALRNPFLNPGTTAAGTATALPAEGLSVSAIMYSGTYESKAIINGRIVQVGDLVGGKTVFRIEPEHVLLKDDQNEYVAKIGALR